MMMPCRELDALIAEKVMGWKAEFRDQSITHGPILKDIRVDVSKPILAYSSDIAAAFGVLNSTRFTSWAMKYDRESKIYTVQLECDGNRFFGQSETAPHAICLAALTAIEA